jgi:Uma2 family endonuclease
MTTKTPKLTVDAYLAYDDGKEMCHELVDGELVEMPPKTKRNNLIAHFLLSYALSTVCSHVNADFLP